MSWFSRQPEPNRAPAATPLHDQRKRHIDSLYKHNHGLPFSSVTVRRSNVEFSVEVKTSTAPVSINIELPPNFPNARPNVRCPNFLHPWIETNSGQCFVTGCQSLNNFYMHSDLGRAIREVVDEFMKRPPQPMAAPGYGYNSRAPAPPQPGYPQQQGYHPSQPPRLPPPARPPMPVPSMQMPQMPVVPGRKAPAPPAMPETRPRRMSWKSPVKPKDFPELDKYSDEELTELNEHPEKLFAFLQDLASVQKLQEDRDVISSENEQQAEINLNHEPELKEKLDDLVEQHKNLASLRKTFEETQEKYQSKAQELSDETIFRKLQAETQKLDDNCEEIAENFLNGEIDIQKFVQVHKEERMRYHLLKAKEEKLQRRLHGAY